jgi:outer membrane murein-binding lipoprotein Lpp
MFESCRAHFSGPRCRRQASGNMRAVMRLRAAVLLLLVLAGCGVPGSLAKQAEDVSSIAAEAAILAHDASEGDTTAVFTRVHARSLRQKLEALQAAIESPQLGMVAGEVAAQLKRLEADPGDQSTAADVERRLERAAETAGEIETSA